MSIFALIAPIKHIAKSLLAFVAVASIGLFQTNASVEESLSGVPDPITIFAAASLAEVMQDLTEKWRKQPGGVRTRISLGASGVTARQIEAGAKADLFISANRKWTNYLVEAGFSSGKNPVVAKNSLVMVWPCSQLDQLPNLDASDALKKLLMTRRFAVADPSVSPAGDYTKTALEALAIWDDVAENAAYAGNVRLALLLTERGGLPGFVYGTDAGKSSLACEVMQLPASSYPSIEYIAMIPRTRDGSSKEAAIDFQQWLASPTAATIWKKHGFQPTVPK